MTDGKFLKRLYGKCDNNAETLAVYREWADSYDQEIIENGYVTPERCAKALAEYSDDLSAPCLDVGCGTGMSGLALREEGFITIDGMDMSQEMLAQAQKRLGVYHQLHHVSVDNPFPFMAGDYTQIVAVGVIAVNHAPPETIASVLQKLHKGGLFVFSLNDHTLTQPEYLQALQDVLEEGIAETLLQEHGPHLPGLSLGANVYVLKRL